MARNTRTYTDLDFNFLLHPRSKDVSIRSDEEAVKQSIRNLVMTRNYERPFRSYIGSQVNTLLFEPASYITTNMIERSISDVINNFEPRAVLISVNSEMKYDDNTLNVVITFKMKNTEAPITVSMILERTR